MFLVSWEDGNGCRTLHWAAKRIARSKNWKSVQGVLKVHSCRGRKGASCPLCDCSGDLLLEDLVDGQVDLYLTVAGDFLLKVMERGRSSVPAWPVNRFRWTTCK